MRDEGIDILRFIGLSMIILAHAAPPPLLFQLRNFDVPLMILISGAAFSIGSNHTESYFAYVQKRLIRLLAPTWLFLTAYFVCCRLTSIPEALPDNKTIINSYLLLGGIGYVWVIRVFLLAALSAPLIHASFRAIGLNKTISFLLLAVAACEAIANLPFINQDNLAYKLFKNCILFPLPFTFLFAIGMAIQKPENTKVLKAALYISFIVFISFASALYLRNGVFVQTQNYKYPPQAYYTSYALLISLPLFVIREKLAKLFAAIQLGKAASFIGSNTIWVYFWHIPLTETIDLDYAPKFMLVYLGAAGLCYLQKIMVDTVLRHTSNRSITFICKHVLAG